MATKTISLAERPVLTAGELLDVMRDFRGKGAGPPRKKR